MRGGPRTPGARSVYTGLACLMLCAMLPAAGLCRPVVAVSSPADQATVYGETWVNVAFRSDSRRPVVRLELLLDGREVQSYVVPTPLLEGEKSFAVDFSAVSPGPHTLMIRALDSVGEAGVAQVTFNVQSSGGMAPGPTVDRIPPAVSIFYPAHGATVSGRVTVRAEVTDNVGVRNVMFYVNGKLHTIRMNAPPFQAEWDTTAHPDGTHVLEARAKDTAGNEGFSSPVTVVVQNTTPIPLTPAPGVVPGPPEAAPGLAWAPPPVRDPAPVVTPAPGLAPPVVAPAPSRVEPLQPDAPPGPVAPQPVAPATPPAPEVAYTPTQPAIITTPDLAPEHRLEAPPSLSAEAPVPSGEASVASIPGTDLTVPDTPGPELAVPDALVALAPGQADPFPALQGIPAAPQLLETPGEIIAQPEVETVSAPELAVAESAPPVVILAEPGQLAPVTAPALPDVPWHGAVAMPALEALPEVAEPESGPPAPPVAPEPEAGLQLTPAPADPAPVAPPVLLTPETAVPAVPDSGGSSTPPVPVAPSGDAPGVGAGPAGGLISAPVELYHAGPLHAVPEASITPAPATPRPAPTRPADTVVSTPVIIEEARVPGAGLSRGAEGGPSPVATTPPQPEAAAGTDQAEAVSVRPLTAADAEGLSDARVLFRGNLLPSEARPVVHDGVLMISLKHVFEAAEDALYWFADGGTARLVIGDTDMAVEAGSARATVNGQSRELPAATAIHNGLILVPVDLVSGALGVDFLFDPDSREVLITDAAPQP